MRIHRTIAVMAVLVLGVASCGGGEDEPAQPDATDAIPTAAETVTETVTEEVTETETGGETATGSPTDTARDSDGSEARSDQAQDLVVSPQEPITTAPSDPHDEGGRGVAEFRVGTTYDGSELPAALSLGYVPCESVLGSDGPGVLFEGLPEVMGQSDTGEAFIFTIEEERAEVAGDWPRHIEGNDDGELTFAFNAERPDCLAPVVFEDVDDDGQLDVDDAGAPTEPYGYGKVTWQGD